MIRQFSRAAVSAIAICVLVAVTVLVHHQTDDLILLTYWYLGASVISACLIAFVIGRRYKDNPVAQVEFFASFLATTRILAVCTGR